MRTSFIAGAARVLALSVALSVGLSLALPLTACGNERDTDSRALDPGASTTAAAPTPVADGEVTTQGLVTVLDAGDGPMLCSAVADSYPPQCQGTPITGWDWTANSMHEEASGTRWGSFALTGTFDGTTLQVSDAVPAALYDVPNTSPADPGTPCEPPEGGWIVVDAGKTDDAAMEGVFRAAQRLPGYAGAWLSALDSTAGVEQPAPGSSVLNVAVAEDVAGAEATLRESWGGPLCVIQAQHTADELTELAPKIQAALDAQSVAGHYGVIDATVIFDDGSIQQWADDTYGEGLVSVTSVLQPVG